MTVWAAYNDWGDLVAEAYTQNDLLRFLASVGIDEDEVYIGRVTP